LTVIGGCDAFGFIPLKFVLLPAEPIGGGLSCGAFDDDWLVGGKLLAEPIPVFLDAPTVAPGPFCGDCEARVQLSSVQESVGFATVFLVSCGPVALRGNVGKSESRVADGRD
jgi:hypothetical protein